MVEFRRMTRVESTKRAGPFGASTVDITEDEYEIKAETAGEVCIVIKTQEKEKQAFLQES